MAVVYEAVHVGTGRRVALKIIRDVAQLGDDRETWLERFRREARTIGVLHTPHIIDVLDAGTDDVTGLPFIAMELLAGADLSRLLKRTGALPPSCALKIVGQACLALERAHEAGVIHRDIKPGNVFLAEGRSGKLTVKLVDFGIAKVGLERRDGVDAELTQTGSLLGTPTYMSPEQARGLKSIDHRADLWALAVVLYRALSNRVPHPMRDGLGQLIVRICTEPAPPIQLFAPWVPANIAKVLDRALQLDIRLRYQTAAEFRADIEELLGDGLELEASKLRPLTDAERAVVEKQYPSRTVSATPCAISGTPKVTRLRHWPLLGTMAVVAISAAIAGSTLRGGRESSPTRLLRLPPLPALSRIAASATEPPAADAGVTEPRSQSRGASQRVNGGDDHRSARARHAQNQNLKTGDSPEPETGVGLVHDFE